MIRTHVVFQAGGASEQGTMTPTERFWCDACPRAISATHGFQVSRGRGPKGQQAGPNL
jgi:hypothetical protein